MELNSVCTVRVAGVEPRGTSVEPPDQSQLGARWRFLELRCLTGLATKTSIVCPERAKTYQPRATPWGRDSIQDLCPERAQQSNGGITAIAELYRPFRAWGCFSNPLPRALPWADMSLPLRGEQTAQLQNWRSTPATPFSSTVHPFFSPLHLGLTCLAPSVRSFASLRIRRRSGRLLPTGCCQVIADNSRWPTASPLPSDPRRIDSKT